MKWSTEAKVGAFTLAGILLFAGLMFQLSHMVLFGKDGFHVTGYFSEAQGIESGNAIRYAGVEVGRVDGVSVSRGEAVLSLRLYDGSEIPKDAVFTIQSSSIMGGTFVNVAGGNRSRGLLEDGMTIRGSAAPSMESIMVKVDTLADTAQNIMNGLNNVISDRETQKHAKNIIGNVDVLTQNLAILTAQGIEISRNVDAMTAQLSGMMAQFNGDGKAGAKARVILDNLAVTSENAKEISVKARHISDKLGKGAQSDFLKVSGDAEILYNTRDEKYSPNFNVQFGTEKFFRLGYESVGSGSFFNAQVGRRQGAFDVYAGLIRGNVGVGATYRVDRFRIGADLYNPNDMTFRFKGSFEIQPHVFATVQTIRPFNREGGGNYFGVTYTY